jgi:uncharacterized protein YukE
LKNIIVIPMPGLLTGLRATNLYRRLEKEGRLRGDSLGNNTHHLGFNFQPQLDEDYLIQGYKELLQKLFDDRNYYQRCRKLHERLGPTITNARLERQRILALIKSLKRQLFAKGGWEYGKYLLFALLKHPRRFPLAVANAIKLDHFKTITRATLEVDAYHRYVENLYRQFAQRAKKICADYQEMRKVINSIQHESATVISKAERRIDKIHKDFRRDAAEALDDLRRRINSEIERYRNALEMESSVA